jgi:hypothetical protein
LLQLGGHLEELSTEIANLEGSCESVSLDSHFKAVRELAKYNPGFRQRLAEFYDPSDLKPTPVRKDALLAYVDYREAYFQGQSSARAGMERIERWASGPESSGDPAAAEIKRMAGVGGRG